MIQKYQIDAAKALRTYAEKRHRNPAPAQMTRQLSQTMDANLILIYGLLEDVMNNINNLELALSKSASKEDIIKARSELKSILKDRGKPTQEQIEQFRELTKRAKNVYR